MILNNWNAFSVNSDLHVIYLYVVCFRAGGGGSGMSLRLHL